MEISIAKVTSQGQITIPADIRKLLGVQPGGKVVFIQDGNRVMMANATVEAFEQMHASFAPEAERLGLKNDQDIVNLVKQARAERRKEASNADHA
jgi:AbrB family looped-hinge helix DNA binding protein